MQRPRRRPPRRVSVLGVFGELLITAGILVGLFLGWQVWLNNIVTAHNQTVSAQQQTKKLLKESHDTSEVSSDDHGSVPVMSEPADYQTFAVIYIPRLGQGWQRSIRQTVDAAQVLNSYDAGVGHYTSSQMPGAIGNFAVAGHDSGWGNSFIDLSKLHIGDKIYVQTKQGWYTYSFRNFQYVQPTDVTVISAVPGFPEREPFDRLMTITTCNPPFHAAERLIAYSVFDSFSPPNDVPAQIAAQVKEES